MALDFEKTAADIVEKVGGPENVQAVTHCMTRLRFIVKDEEKVDVEGIKSVKGVLGCVVAAGQIQVILGANLVDTYTQVTKNYHFKEEAAIDENPDADAASTDKDLPLWKRAGKSLIGYISASVTPCFPLSSPAA